MMRRLLALTALSLTALVFAGCASDTSYGAISKDLTPELMGSGERAIDVDRHYAVTKNNNLRMASDDLMRVWYLDHPSRLSPYPITYTAGTPR